MKTTLLTIRHGATRANLERRYSGSRRDEPLEPTSVAALEASPIRARYFADESIRLFVSPMRRCRQTASILFPKRRYEVVDALREYDFGEFDGKSHAELADDARYQRWLDSRGLAAPPGGESRAAFSTRVADAWEQLLRRVVEEERCRESSRRTVSIVIVAHSGTIMALGSYLTGEDFYRYYPPLGGGFRFELVVERIAGTLGTRSEPSTQTLDARALAVEFAGA